jgi:hypothetical protein
MIPEEIGTEDNTPSLRAIRSIDSFLGNGDIPNRFYQSAIQAGKSYKLRQGIYVPNEYVIRDRVVTNVTPRGEYYDVEIIETRQYTNTNKKETMTLTQERPKTNVIIRTRYGQASPSELFGELYCYLPLTGYQVDGDNDCVDRGKLPVALRGSNVSLLGEDLSSTWGYDFSNSAPDNASVAEQLLRDNPPADGIDFDGLAWRYDRITRTVDTDISMEANWAKVEAEIKDNIQFTLDKTDDIAIPYYNLIKQKPEDFTVTYAIPGKTPERTQDVYCYHVKHFIDAPDSVSAKLYVVLPTVDDDGKCVIEDLHMPSFQLLGESIFERWGTPVTSSLPYYLDGARARSTEFVVNLDDEEINRDAVAAFTNLSLQIRQEMAQISKAIQTIVMKRREMLANMPQPTVKDYIVNDGKMLAEAA